MLAVLVLVAIYFTRQPRPGEPKDVASPAVVSRAEGETSSQDPGGDQVVASPAVATAPVEGKPPEAAATPTVATAKPVPPIAWRDASLPPASQDPDAPLLLVQLHSLERMFDDLKVVGEAAGLTSQINDFFALLRVNGGEAGLPGIDAKKSWGAYVHFPPGASSPRMVALVPVSNEAAFLMLLAAINCPADRDDTGLYLVRSRHLPAPVRFRIADDYAYGTFGDPAALDDGQRIAPERLFPRRIDEDMVVTARADRLPTPIRTAILLQIDGRAEMVRGQMAGASREQQDWARKFTESVSTLTRDVFEGKAELILRLGIDQAAREIVADLHLRGAPGSRLARNLSALSPGPSRFGGVIAGNPALAVLAHVRLSDDYSRLLAGLARKATEQVALDAGANFWKEHAKFFEQLENVLKAGELDVATAIRSHGAGKPGSLFGLKVPDGDALDQLFRDLLVKDVTPEDRAPFKLNADDLRGAKVHRYDTAALARDMPRFAPLLGGGPNLIGFSTHAVWLAAGTRGLDTLRDALNDRSGPTPIFHFELNTKSLAELVSAFSFDAPRIDDVRATLTNEHPGRLRLTLESGADLLRLRQPRPGPAGSGRPPREDPGAIRGTAGEPLRRCGREMCSIPKRRS